MCEKPKAEAGGQSGFVVSGRCSVRRVQTDTHCSSAGNSSIHANAASTIALIPDSYLIKPLPRHFAVVERQAFVADDLIGLVTFASDQHAVAGTGQASAR